MKRSEKQKKNFLKINKTTKTTCEVHPDFLKDERNCERANFFAYFCYIYYQVCRWHMVKMVQ